MVDKRKSCLLLLIIAAVGFFYRFALMTMNGYPPGADIGLHESVINSILAPKTTVFYNYYHMGGGLSATNPGYHIFASFLISMTGAPSYLIQAMVASLFSTLIILGAFMVVRLVWNEQAGFVVAVLITFSASDILMLSWGGYPNIVALALIPLLFHLFLQPAKLSQKNYLSTSALIVTALFLTHLYSAIIFLVIILFALLVSVVFSKSTNLTIKGSIYWLLPIFAGVVLSSPYLINIIPVYFGSEAAITGNVSVMKQAVVETRTVPLQILGLAIIPIALFLVFSKKQNGKVFTLPSVLFASAVLIPLVATQSYLFGFFLDYERFVYFLALPVIVCLGLIVMTASNMIIQRLGKIWAHLVHTKIHCVLVSVFLIVCLFTPIFTLPHVGLAQSEYFQLMTPAKYEAIQWVQNNTAEGSVCVADAEFGWWLSGFAKRPTLSAVDPQFLILQREFEPARIASNLLEADYLVDNGLLQIKQTDPFANDNVHDIYAVLNNSVVKPLVFSLNDTQVSLLYRDSGQPKEMRMTTFTDAQTRVLNRGDSTSFIISRENQIFRVTEEITVFRGMRFAEIVFVFESQATVNFDWMRIPFQARGFPVQYANSIGIVDNTMHMVNQIVFPQNQLGNDVMLQENPDFYELVCSLGGQSRAEFRFFVGLCPYDTGLDNPQADVYNNLIENNTKTYLNTVLDLPINCFDYKRAIEEWNISYIVLRDTQEVNRFLYDALFEMAFKNSEVTIFRVIKA
ncbi:hypothetical protein [Candidatus Bathycorpusculum sp.]|uniref:hypothetical protein n=1 Tax=Candidatus Bathycorpusculum sp. TaxID=2994959 RepID=UPI00282DB681|nr:hypothetical protein [Candidatus Termitimicrobium sp.]MCL2431245.1 hypothetical protein [Candidatus Termitimicrobium sp.]